jgi:uncharacterized protein (TIRG00374 family)
MPTDRIAVRTVAFFLLTSAANFAGLIVFGLALATGILPGSSTLTITLVPALVASAVVSLVLWLPRIVESDRVRVRRRSRAGRIVARFGAAVGRGAEEAVRFLRSGDPLVYGGSIGYWAFDNAVLLVCFRALGHTPPVAVVVVAYLVGQLGSSLPLPAGIGGVDLGLIGMLVLFDVPATTATAAVVSYHAIQLSVPAILGGIALVRLRAVFSAGQSAASASGSAAPG